MYSSSSSEDKLSLNSPRAANFCLISSGVRSSPESESDSSPPVLVGVWTSTSSNSSSLPTSKTALWHTTSPGVSTDTSTSLSSAACTAASTTVSTVSTDSSAPADAIMSSSISKFGVWHPILTGDLISGVSTITSVSTSTSGIPKRTSGDSTLTSVSTLKSGIPALTSTLTSGVSVSNSSSTSGVSTSSSTSGVSTSIAAAALTSVSSSTSIFGVWTPILTGELISGVSTLTSVSTLKSGIPALTSTLTSGVSVSNSRSGLSTSTEAAIIGATGLFGGTLGGIEYSTGSSSYARLPLVRGCSSGSSGMFIYSASLFLHSSSVPDWCLLSYSGSQSSIYLYSQSSICNYHVYWE